MFLVACSAFLWRFQLKTYGELSYSFFLHYNNIWNEKVQNSVFYEAFLPITVGHQVF